MDSRKIIAALALCFALCGPTASAQGEQANEYRLKAAFLFNFAKFINWPSAAFANAQAPFTLCVLGPDPFGEALDDAFSGKTIADRRIELRRLPTDADARPCHIIFVSRSQGRHVTDIVKTLRGASALLVGESEGFDSSGGTIEFTLEENHVRFRINPDAAARAGLVISSKLLALAKIVHDGDSDGKG